MPFPQFRTPLFAGVGLLIVAVGIATNAIIFSVADAVLFRSLPLHEPDRLVRVFEQSPDGDQAGVAPATLGDVKRHVKSLEDVATLTLDGFNLTGAPEPEVVMGAWVSPNLFACSARSRRSAASSWTTSRICAA